MMRWGLVPHWAKDESIGYKMINARAESVATKPSFSGAFKTRRCIIPVSGFYEWKRHTSGGDRQPHYFKMSDEDMIPLAGLWEQWRDVGGNILHTCAIITVSASNIMHSIHNRMPAILCGSNEDKWLDSDSTKSELTDMLSLSTDEGISKYPVSTICNSPRNDVPDCVEPL